MPLFLHAGTKSYFVLVSSGRGKSQHGKHVPHEWWSFWPSLLFTSCTKGSRKIFAELSKAFVLICLLVIYDASTSTPQHRRQGGMSLHHTWETNVTWVVWCNTCELFTLLGSTEIQLTAGLHRQFIDLSRKRAGQPQRYFNSSTNLIIYGVADSSDLSFAARAWEKLKYWLRVDGTELG